MYTCARCGTTACCESESGPFPKNCPTHDLDREGLAGAEDIVRAGDEARVRGLLAPYLDSGATELIFQIAANDADRQRTREFVATLV